MTNNSKDIQCAMVLRPTTFQLSPGTVDPDHPNWGETMDRWSSPEYGDNIVRSTQCFTRYETSFDPQSPSA